ncbi:MAG: ATP-binding protein [Proteobacteria bacterium]|nr:ATP-binding protein [Pseudomonadota bacterium]
MQPPAIPPDETARLRALSAYEILDTPTEPAFEAIVALAATILGVPIALISIVDEVRQWFKARVGLDVPETSREVSFCGHVVAARAPLIVHDAFADARFVDNPLVTGHPLIRFYVGMPLRTPEGFLLGTLCAIDHERREPSPEQLASLELLANQVVALLELRRVGLQLREERRVLAAREVELHDQARKFEALFEGISDGVALQDRSGAFLHHNLAAEQILGLTREQLLGITSMDPRWRATHEDGRPFPGHEHPAMVTLRTGVPQTDVPMCIYRGDEACRWLSVTSRPLLRPDDPEPYAVIVTFRDTTEQRATADRLAQHQRLVTAGTLAAGVGHEINNPLTYIQTNLSLALEELGTLTSSSPTRLAEITTMLEEAREGTARVAQIVRGLKALARADATVATGSEVNAIIRNALQLAGHAIRTRASTRLELAVDTLVTGDESRLVQVLVHLLVNAAQAFTSTDPSTNLIVVRTAIPAGRGVVVIEVTDNGPGIAPEVLPQIFDPFFTTKQVGGGIGLGLSISHGIVTALGGELRCETQLGSGTIFQITLPTPVATPVAPAPASHERRKRVLIVDDEPQILRVISRALQRDFDVNTINDPREALRRIEAGETFDLVFCDLSMPYLTGMELYEAIIAIRPELGPRMVFISGDVTREDIRRFLARVPNERLEKPVSLANLRDLARRFAS